MYVPIIAILCGILLSASILPKGADKLVTTLMPFKVVLGIVALVVGIIHIFSFSLIVISLILAGLMLAADALISVPKIGDNLRRMGKQLSAFNVLLGVFMIVYGFIVLLRL